jgi:hypothetical protein
MKKIGDKKKANKLAKVLSWLVVLAILICAMPCVAAALNEAGDDTKIVDREKRLALAESRSTAHLKNNVLDLYLTEQNSNLWQYQWEPGQWGESCYHEHFGVYTDNAGRTLESEEFTVDQPFSDPGGVPGTVTAILHYGDVQVKRKITLISGDIRFFEIEYTIKNIGSSTLNDVRFFQTIDFDIPWTGDHTDDHAWYDAENDYVIVKDDEYFENSFTGSIHSDRHGIDYWRTEIYDDWDDGNLNNVDSYGPGDPAIGMQYNLGNLAAGDDEIVTITVWSGEPTEPMEPKINSITFGDNKGNHHTDKYPSEYIVLRRGQSFDLNADIENFDDGNHKIIFAITKPNGQTHEITAIKDGILGSGWDCSYTRKWYNQNKFHFKIHIPGNEQVGDYQLTCEIQKKDGTETYDTTDTPEFYVIFNPWSSEDVDVYNRDFSDTELNHYVIGKDGYNYHPSGGLVTWTIQPANQKIFSPAIETVSGDTAVRSAASKLSDKCRYTTDPNEVIEGRWGRGRYRADWRNALDLINAWDSSTNTHPTGQCMDFGGLLNAFERSVGIPSRMLTNINSYDPHRGTVWNFHVWDENWVTHVDDTDWSEIDGTYNHGPVPKSDRFIQDEISTSTAVYTYDAKDNTKINILDDYVSASTYYGSGTLSKASLNGINILINTQQKYSFGDDMVINVTIINNQNIPIAKWLNLTISEVKYDDFYPFYSYNQSINLQANSNLTVSHNIPVEEYLYNGLYEASAILNGVTNATYYEVLSGINLTTSVPEIVNVNETFEVSLETKNILDIPVTDIEIQAEFPYYADVAGAPMNFTIPTLAPGSTHLTTWFVSIPDDGYQSMEFSAQSERGDYERISTGTEVMSNPFLRVDVEVPSSVQKDTAFAVNVTIVNEGDLAAEDVQSTLNLPPGLTTPDDWIRNIGTIDPHANTTIVWNITANEAGTLSFTILTSSSTTSGEDVIFIPIFIYDHDLELSVEQSQLESDGELHCINMTIHNLGNVEDSVLLQYLVPASGDKILNLKIIPEHNATGTITIHATSELDPTASDSTTIDVIPAVDDIVIFRNGRWWISKPDHTGTDYSFNYGIPGDMPVVGDVNNDGVDDVVIFRNGKWWVCNPDHTGTDYSFNYGIPGDIPVIGDVNNDGVDDVVIFRNGKWWVCKPDHTGTDYSFNYGIPGDKPVVGDIG